MSSSLLSTATDSTSTNPGASFPSQEEKSLRALVKDRPQNGRAMAKLACLLVDQAKLVGMNDPQRVTVLRREALEWTHRSIQVAPEKPFGYMSLSVLEQEHSKRMIALRKAIEYHPNNDTSFVELGLLIRLLRDPVLDEARQVSGKIGRASPLHPLKRPLNEGEEELYCRITQGLGGFWNNAKSKQSATRNEYEVAKNEYRLGVFFRKRLPVETSRRRAHQHFSRAVEHLPPDDEACIVSSFWLGTLGYKQPQNRIVIDRCPPSYIISLYSKFAEKFDNLLVQKLSYQTPTVLRQLVDQHFPRTFSRGLDLGCGTGLSGAAFRDKIDNEWMGVDLSPQMIAKAQERQCYSSLQVGDVTSCLVDQADSQLDFVLACDVLVYLGDLTSVLEGVFRVLKTNGVFAFSTELLENSNQDEEEFALHECARFAHSRGYIERLAAFSSACHFEVICMERCTLRKNQGEDVIGTLTILKKNV